MDFMTRIVKILQTANSWHFCPVISILRVVEFRAGGDLRGTSFNPLILQRRTQAQEEEKNCPEESE